MKYYFFRFKSSLLLLMIFPPILSNLFAIILIGLKITRFPLKLLNLSLSLAFPNPKQALQKPTAHFPFRLGLSDFSFTRGSKQVGIIPVGLGVTLRLSSLSLSHLHTSACRTDSAEKKEERSFESWRDRLEKRPAFFSFRSSAFSLGLHSTAAEEVAHYISHQAKKALSKFKKGPLSQSNRSQKLPSSQWLSQRGVYKSTEIDRFSFVLDIGSTGEGRFIEGNFENQQNPFRQRSLNSSIYLSWATGNPPSIAWKTDRLQPQLLKNEKPMATFNTYMTGEDGVMRSVARRPEDFFEVETAGPNRPNHLPGQADNGPQYGLLTQTVASASVIQQVFPARIRSKDQRDVIFVAVRTTLYWSALV